jgi:hypothetical protein
MCNCCTLTSRMVFQGMDWNFLNLKLRFKFAFELLKNVDVVIFSFTGSKFARSIKIMWAETFDERKNVEMKLKC